MINQTERNSFDQNQKRSSRNSVVLCCVVLCVLILFIVFFSVYMRRQGTVKFLAL